MAVSYWLAKLTNQLAKINGEGITVVGCIDCHISPVCYITRNKTWDREPGLI